MWGCRKHWFMLPKNLRDKIWKAYRPGQEKDMQPSAEYLAVADGVQKWIAQFLKKLYEKGEHGIVRKIID